MIGPINGRNFLNTCSITRLTQGVPQSVSGADSTSVVALGSQKGFSTVFFDSVAFSSVG